MSRTFDKGSLGALTFQPHFEERVWGGRNLAGLGRAIPASIPIGESWEISSIPGRPSVVARGAHAGLGFDDLLRAGGDAILGDAPRSPALFPLLFKLLDSTQALSVQLHPNDREALALEGPGEGSVGKTEAWLVLAAEPGAEIIHGLAPGVASADLYDSLEALQGGALSGDLERSLFRWIPVHAGDVIFIPAGTIHALGAGVVLAEVQQSSDITYRIYDWGRRDPEGQSRELHIDKARGVELVDEGESSFLSLRDAGDSEPVIPLVVCDKFRFDLVSLHSGRPYHTSTVHADRSGFHILFGWTGTTLYRGPAGDQLEIDPLRFVLLPACLGEYELSATDADTRCILFQ